MTHNETREEYGEMRITAFLLLLAISVIAVGAWSISSGATVGVVTARVLITLVALQFGYLALIILWSMFGTSVEAKPKRRPSTMVPGPARNSENTKVS
ncbi:hypothetical protein [Pseudaestuariivita rosea]|uniref:hypothetical protein n=1 Tax=Pseudaestuariivita rosea TaxID=2763263 RepID=UPI001ABBA4B9|nr:hypothetical protein [Pseudaestuariivita rosea]